MSAFAHVIRDTAVVAMFAFLAASVAETSNMTIVDILGWQAYAFFQGAALTAGGSSRTSAAHVGSPPRSSSTTVSPVLHSFLLVPYYSWQYSPRQAPRQDEPFDGWRKHTTRTPK